MQAEGAVVVARWYGGQNIGPVRFTHIENTAKEAIWKWQVVDQAQKKEEAAKKQKREEDAERRALEEYLRERDQSIVSMRGLLAEKKARLEDSEVAPPTPQKAMNYGSMTMEMLRRQERSRDATIALILKKIKEVEEKLELVEVFEESENDEFSSTQETYKDAQEYQKTTDDTPGTAEKD